MNRNVKVVPAILTDSASELTRMVVLANGFAPWVQIDMMDGLFVPSRSITTDDLGPLEFVFSWEAHLMVVDPLRYLVPLRDAGAARVIFHAESDDDAYDVIDLCRSLGMGVGVAVNPPTTVSEIEPLLSAIDSVLLMAVYPGYYGAPFVPGVLSKIGEVRAACPDVEIGMDGGIKESNLVEVARYGLDKVCVGSAIFGQPDPAASYRRLAALAHGA